MSSSRAKPQNQGLQEALESHRGPLLSRIRKTVRDQVEAEDVLQDVFAEFIETYNIGVAIESMGGWLARVAQNKVLDRFRRRKTQREYQAREQVSAEEPAVAGNEWMRDWVREEILAAIETLPPEQAEVFVQHELEGKSFEDIAAETGVSVNTLLSRKRYAVLALREYLKEVYDELE